jgi:hypothetical protein
MSVLEDLAAESPAQRSEPVSALSHSRRDRLVARWISDPTAAQPLVCLWVRPDQSEAKSNEGGREVLT